MSLERRGVLGGAHCPISLSQMGKLRPRTRKRVARLCKQAKAMAGFFSAQHLNLEQCPSPSLIGRVWLRDAHKQRNYNLWMSRILPRQTSYTICVHRCTCGHTHADSFSQPTPARVHPWRPDSEPACQMR